MLECGELLRIGLKLFAALDLVDEFAHLLVFGLSRPGARDKIGDRERLAIFWPVNVGEHGADECRRQPSFSADLGLLIEQQREFARRDR